MFCVEAHNGANNMYISSTGEAAGFYFEYSLVNHMCQPNCEFKNDKCNAAPYALQDIEPGSQLGNSYLQSYTSVEFIPAELALLRHEAPQTTVTALYCTSQ